ncbi:uncharacterized protein LOC113385565 [Ctenocephalides felis]|uniref:uncharacterized protein LOC113385565 n=1 Tax=Ctenocephalides felis TaxID=7515 RepID=UPI000E6E41D2|nr:uncharacterized protein LOC113385565 [Ctenocephalides felis]
MISLGTQCEEDTDCNNPLQWCSFGNCRCKAGLIQHEGFCYNVTTFGNPCQEESQCLGLFCYAAEKGGPTTCQCGRFGAYNRTTEKCDYSFDQLESLLEKEDNEGRIEREADYIFHYVVIAGCIAMIMMATVGFSAILYCIYMKKQDEKLKSWLRKAELNRRKTSTGIGSTTVDPKAADAMHTMDVPGDMDASMAFDM